MISKSFIIQVQAFIALIVFASSLTSFINASPIAPVEPARREESAAIVVPMLMARVNKGYYKPTPTNDIRPRISFGTVDLLTQSPSPTSTSTAAESTSTCAETQDNMNCLFGTNGTGGALSTCSSQTQTTDGQGQTIDANNFQTCLQTTCPSANIQCFGLVS